MIRLTSRQRSAAADSAPPDSAAAGPASADSAAEDPYPAGGTAVDDHTLHVAEQVCPLCAQPIESGDEVRRKANGEYVHLSC